jgi:hypothetical protein
MKKKYADTLEAVASRTSVLEKKSAASGGNHYKPLPYSSRAHPCLVPCFPVIAFIRRKMVVHGSRATKTPPAAGPAYQDVRVSFQSPQDLRCWKQPARDDPIARIRQCQYCDVSDIKQMVVFARQEVGVNPDYYCVIKNNKHC